jgi:hypothetical protein
MLTFFINKKRNYWQLTRKGLKEVTCAWAPRIRNRLVLDSDNTFRISRKEISRIGIYTYGFTEFIILKTDNPESDYYEINVTVPVDEERTPRSKKVLIRGNRAYFYEVNGEVKKHLNPLKKKASRDV